MKKQILLFLFSALILAAGVAVEPGKKEVAVNAFKSVSMEEGLKLMAGDGNFILLDVRTPEEFAQGHIPGAVQLTNETFTRQDAERVIRDKGQTVYVYCRSGRRSRQSSQKLVDFGYANVIEIGGIISYHGTVER